MRVFARFACPIAWLGVLAMAAQAQELEPYPAPKITVEQWTTYADEVRQRHQASAQIYRDKQLVAFSDQRTRTFWVFTLKDHPAHPAWLTRQMFEEGGQVRVRQIGYFAGSEAEFARLFAEYQERNEQLREDVEERNR
ncbi:MAG: hypothetical protein ACREVI_03565 [Steroidobacteraceae bacterium]